MPLTKNAYSMRDGGQFVTALKKLDRNFIGIVPHPHKMPLPEMISRMMGHYQGDIYRDISDGAARQVIKVHRTALAMMNRLERTQVIQGESLAETLTTGIKGSLNRQAKLFNLAALHIITFPLYHVYSSVPEYVFAGQNVRSSYAYGARGAGGRRSRQIRLQSYPHKWDKDYGYRALRMGKPGLLQSISFFRWFVKFLQGKKFKYHHEYISFLTDPRNADTLKKVSTLALQFLSVSRLRKEGGLAPPKKKMKDREL